MLSCFKGSEFSLKICGLPVDDYELEFSLQLPGRAGQGRAGPGRAGPAGPGRAQPVPAVIVRNWLCTDDPMHIYMAAQRLKLLSSDSDKPYACVSRIAYLMLMLKTSWFYLRRVSKFNAPI